ncbi:retinol dehydrogenase 12-like [Culicoides brevitarsis]|uniref:retinol dehydrogenase 12-like n=1 Tax=Culicoides brevitarsis TaxID=469753 RepID=UPI00307B63A7
MDTNIPTTPSTPSAPGFDFLDFLQNPWFLGIAGSVGGVLVLTAIHFFIKGKSFTNPIKADKQVVVITGNSSRGKEVVRELATRGATIYIGTTDVEKCENFVKEVQNSTKNKNIFVKKLNLGSHVSIREFVDSFLAEQQRLDVLIHDESVLKWAKTKTEDGLELHFGVNHVGQFVLTNLLLETLKKSAPARVLVVSNILYHCGAINKEDLNSEKSYSFHKAYPQSKLANLLFVRELSRRLEESDVTVNAVYPGLVQPEIEGIAGKIGDYVINLILKPYFWTFFKTPTAGAQTILYGALEPELKNTTGKYLQECSVKDLCEKSASCDLAKYLWDETEKIVAANQAA